MSIGHVFVSPIRRAIICCKRDGKFHVEIRGQSVHFECEHCGQIFVILGTNMLLQQRKLEAKGQHSILSQEPIS